MHLLRRGSGLPGIRDHPQNVVFCTDRLAKCNGVAHAKAVYGLLINDAASGEPAQTRHTPKHHDRNNERKGGPQHNRHRFPQVFGRRPYP